MSFTTSRKIFDHEYVRLVTELADELYNNNKPRIPTDSTFPIDIAIETANKKIVNDIFIQRTLPNGSKEQIAVNDLLYKNEVIIDYKSKFNIDMLDS